MKTFARICAVLASTFCFIGGFWILCRTNFKSDYDDALSTAIGFYFVGKAFFVQGPMLWIAGEKFCGKPEAK